MRSRFLSHIEYWLGRLEDFFFLPQKKAFLSWLLISGALQADEAVAILLNHEEYIIRNADRWITHYARKETHHLVFLMVKAGTGRVHLKALNEVVEVWHCIFETSLYEIWEKRSRHTDDHLPFRFGYSLEEKQWVTHEVRRMLEELLSQKTVTPPQKVPQRFNLLQNLDIAVWVEGTIRASVIVEGLACREALLAGVKRVPLDGRFKPLQYDELAKATIEITMMHDLEMPLTWAEFVRGDVDPKKGYVVRQGKQRGWYLPEVHNMVAFQGLSDLCLQLARNKAGIPLQEIQYRFFRQFHVTDWIETKEGIVELVGPCIEFQNQHLTSTDIREIGKRAVHQLCCNLDHHGFLSSVIDPVRPYKQTMDWVRLGCAGHALSVWGTEMQEKEAQDAAHQIWQYLNQYQPFSFLSELTRRATLVYWTRLSLVLGKNADEQFMDLMAKELSLGQYRTNSILWLQTLTLLLEWDAHTREKKYRRLVEREAQAAWVQFEKDRVQSQTAFYPELLAIFYQLEQLYDNGQWKMRALEMISWYRKVQQKDGSFPHSPGRIFAYTRGTGKLFEVLALYKEETEDMLKALFSWLLTMQYDDNNTFHIHPDIRPRFLGGFRHDAMNREVWIDANAHVILGVARIITKKE